MAEWFSRMFHALQGAGPDPVRPALEEAHRARTRLALEVAAPHQDLILTGTVEQVRDVDFVISQPMIGGRTHPLAFAEVVKIGFVQNDRYYRGECRSLGRVKIPSGGSARAVASKSTGAGSAASASSSAPSMLYAYRLSYPTHWHADDRRAAPRTRLQFVSPVQVQLYAATPMGEHFAGEMLDISMTGARIVVPLPQAPLEPGQVVFLKGMLPEPVGSIDDLVLLARVEPEARQNRCVIVVQFQRRVEGLDTLMRTTARAA